MSVAGSLSYVAPEVLNQENALQSVHTPCIRYKDPAEDLEVNDKGEGQHT